MPHPALYSPVRWQSRWQIVLRVSANDFPIQSRHDALGIGHWSLVLGPSSLRAEPVVVGATNTKPTYFGPSTSVGWRCFVPCAGGRLAASCWLWHPLSHCPRPIMKSCSTMMVSLTGTTCQAKMVSHSSSKLRIGGGSKAGWSLSIIRPRRMTLRNNEAAPSRFHSITSSARPRSEGGTVRPSALAVLRLTIRSNLVGCWIGRSAGFAPLRIFPA
jgi:hypothetical protein